MSVENHFLPSVPARIEIRFANEADERRTFGFGSVAPFWELRGSGPTSLMLIPDAAEFSVVDENGDGEFVLVPDDPGENCWQAEDELILTDEVRRLAVGPGATLSETYDVVAAPDASGCLPSGSYRFSQRLDEVVGENETEPLDRWGFSLEVSRS